MSTADFYIGVHEPLWLGSISQDGFPDAAPRRLLGCTSEAEYRLLLSGILRAPEAILPEQGWPWPWRDSSGTQYAYTWHTQLYIAIGGIGWFSETEYLKQRPCGSVLRSCSFPRMRSRSRNPSTSEIPA